MKRVLLAGAALLTLTACQNMDALAPWIEQGNQAARLCAINILAQAKAALGDLERISQCLKLAAYVSCTPDFVDHPQVVNGASDLIVEVLGEKGRHSRLAIGVASLPLDAAVEVEALIAIS